MELVAFVLYVLVCGAIAWLIAKALTRRAQKTWPRWVVAGVLAPVVFFLPFADEIVGKYQFERLCEEAKEEKFHGTIPAGEDLYTPDGKWRLGMPGEDGRHLQKVINTYLRRDHRRLPEIRAAIVIWGEESKIYDARTGRLLAEWRQYSTNGGWFGQKVVAGEGPLIVRQGCGPANFRQIEQTLLKFTKSSEAIK